MTISLNTYASGDSDYISKMNADNAAIKTAIDSLEATAGSGVVSGSTNNVPKGLQYIFDRKGIIGTTSYKPTAGVLSGPSYYLVVTAGGFWDGSALAYQDNSLSLSMSAKTTGTYYVTVDSAGSPSVSASAGSRTVWQFSYDSATHTVSNVAIYAGVAVLFAGPDYADALTSAELSLTFASLADRLEHIESLLVEMGAFYQCDPDTTDGLDFGFRSGKVRNDQVVWATPAGVVTLTDDSTSYLEVDPADGTVSANPTGFTTACIPLYEIVTAAGAITTITDKRTWAAAGGGGEGGGHVQNTDIGTNANAFKLNMDVVGPPSENCQFEVKRGTSPSVSLRWNESSQKWQFTNDGANYKDIMDPTALLAAQEWTKYVGVADPVRVLDSQARSSSIDYETVSLSSYITAPHGVQAVVLRVFFWDSSPGPGVYVALREHGGPAPQTAFSVWSDQYGSALLTLPVGNTLAFDYFVQASGMNTANVQVYLVGYFEKVSGVGTVDRQTVQAGIAVAAGDHAEINIANTCNRGLVHRLRVEETGGLMTGTYSIELYAEDAFLTLLYQAQAINPATVFDDYLPFWVRDADGTSELHVKLINDDSSHAGTFTVTLNYEQFA